MEFYQLDQQKDAGGGGGAGAAAGSCTYTYRTMLQQWVEQDQQTVFQDHQYFMLEEVVDQ
jgi:hypothetical protein